MRGRVQAISCHDRQPLSTGWELCGVPAGAAADPEALSRAAPLWLDAPVPGTVASALRSATDIDPCPVARRLDAEDWWYRTQFVLPEPKAGTSVVLGLDGLATLADVWLDRRHVLHSDNMFVSHEVLLEGVAAGAHELVIRFASLDAHLAKRRPRPRWRTPMVENQQLRWVRATLLGRTPGWSPPAPAVGPWGEVWVEHRHLVSVEDLTVTTSLDGASGVASVGCRVQPLSGTRVDAVRLVLARQGREWQAELRADTGAGGFSGSARVEDVARWWPHTHGEPACYEARLDIDTPGSATIRVALGSVGFREIGLATSAGDCAVSVNGVEIFCRGACWTPLDCVGLGSSRAEYARALAQVRDAGMNMLRVGGTMVYESDAFFGLCDSLGIMVWQDLMFANMDYPADDATFAASVAVEVPAQLRRLQGHPSLAVVCGNSEAGQQAAMWGAPPELWNPPLFAEQLRGYVASALPGAPYVPSSTYGGDFPHQASSGPASYYGVGAYLRPLTDARHADVRFATECLAFANVPEPAALATLGGDHPIKVHFPRWKERVPRDLGAGWDFDDVRDHYLRELFGLDPLTLRYAEHDRYLELGRIASGFVMQRTFAEWRRQGSRTRGALVWFLRDLWLGAGWGLIDSSGEPKAAYWFARRALKPQAVLLSDEGVNGLMIDIVNERPTPLVADLELAAFRGLETRIEHARRPIEVPAHGSLWLSATGLLAGFRDLTYAYRFGPPLADAIVVRLVGADDGVLSEDVFYPGWRPPVTPGDVGLAATAVRSGDRSAQLSISAQRFAFGVRIDSPQWSPAEQLFEVAPDRPTPVRLTATATARPGGSTVRLTAANGRAAITVMIPD